MPDPELVERVDALGSTSFEGHAYRHMGPGYPPLSGEGARISGGRWNPPGSFPALYMGLDVPTVMAEFYRAAQRHLRPPQDLLPRRLYQYEIHLAAVLDLRPPMSRDAAGVSDRDLRGDDLRRCQAVGEAAHYLGLEGLLAPSAVGQGDVLVVFYSRLRAGSSVEVVGDELWSSLPRLSESPIDEPSQERPEG